jgi:protocatechuate 3,4-dioxygenase beta subunit
VRPGKLAALLLLAAGLTGHAQSTPPRDSSTSNQTLALAEKGRISGRIVAEESGDPLRNARVRLSPAAGDVPLVLADADGRFVFPAVPPGTYSISAAKSGYASSMTSARNARRRPVVVQLSPGASIAGVTVSLARGSAISGRVLDELGDPAANTNVFVDSLGDDGKRTTNERWTARTNDLGEYRVGSLPEGQYAVSIAVPRDTQVRVNGTASVAQPPVQITQRSADGSVMTFTGTNVADVIALANRGPQRLYFPNSPTVLEAEAISLKAGEERLSVDFSGPRQQPLPPDLVLAQDPSPLPLDRTAKATGAIHGRVLGATGAPLAGAEVRLSGDGVRPLPPASTDALGQYDFVNLPSGSYRVSARKRGYIGREFGQQRSGDRGDRIVLAVDERRDRADIMLLRTSAIVGQITDEYGDPIEGVSVRAHQIRFVSGRRRLVEVPGASSSRTDDTGRYRVAGLQPGTFAVAAYVGQLVGGQPETADIPGYATTYFPGTPNLPELGLVPVPASQDVDSVNFALSRMATATVSGVARTSTGEPITGGLVLASSRRSGSVSTTPVGARIHPDGKFEFPNVPPGQYVIQAYRGRLKASLEGEFAAVSVAVNGDNISGLVVQTSVGSTISGRFTFDGGRVPMSRNIDLSPVPTDVDLAPLDGNLARADIHGDWTFEMSGISGPRRLQLLRAPRGWGLKQILVKGVDITDMALPFGAENQSLGDVEVVLTEAVTELSGTASDDRGRPAADARIVVFPGERDLWYDRSRFVKIATSDADGTFLVRDLPPGTYFVAAVDRRRASQENGEWLNPELLESLAPGSPMVTLSEGQKSSVSIRLSRSAGL